MPDDKLTTALPEIREYLDAKRPRLRLDRLMDARSTEVTEALEAYVAADKARDKALAALQQADCALGKRQAVLETAISAALLGEEASSGG